MLGLDGVRQALTHARLKSTTRAFLRKHKVISESTGDHTPKFTFNSVRSGEDFMGLRLVD